MSNLQKETWEQKICALESEVMRACPSLVGGRKEKETVEQYAARGMKELQRSLDRLAEARDILRKLSKGETLSQRLIKAGYTRKQSHRDLPSDE